MGRVDRPVVVAYGECKPSQTVVAMVLIIYAPLLTPVVNVQYMWVAVILSPLIGI